LVVGLVSSGFLWPISINESAKHRLYQKNMSFRMPDHTSLLNDILQSGAQFVTLQEVAQRNKALLKGLSKHFPSQHYCDFAGVGGVAVASIYPKVKGSEICHGYGVVSMQVQTDGGPIWVSSIHLHWPWPFGQAEQVEKIIPKLTQLTGRNLIAGDFNMVPWSHLIKDFGRVTDTRVVKGIYRSLPLKGYFTIPIDHVFVPNLQGEGNGELRPLLGSDHLGLLVRFTL
jgi:endonuclease/exonuclease/phosphatase (EEP) superfamily protein YafD